MLGKQQMDIHVGNEIQRIQQERQHNRKLLTKNKMERQTFEKRDTALLRELEGLFIQSNVSKILF